jgi:hypothetical protein
MILSMKSASSYAMLIGLTNRYEIQPPSQERREEGYESEMENARVSSRFTSRHRVFAAASSPRERESASRKIRAVNAKNH